MSQYIVENGELKHYGVIGMKWGVRKNPAKAYAKSLKEKDKRTYARDWHKDKADSARSAHRKTVEARKNLEGSIARTRERLSNEKRDNESLVKTDLSMVSQKGRKEHYRAIRESDASVARQEKALSTQRNASARLLEKAQAQNKNATRRESIAASSQRKLSRFTRVMDSTFKDLDPAIIAEGEAMYRTYKETRKWK